MLFDAFSVYLTLNLNAVHNPIFIYTENEHVQNAYTMTCKLFCSHISLYGIDSIVYKELKWNEVNVTMWLGK